MKFKFGCDPEIFLTKADGSLRSAIDTFGGTKEHPMQLPLGPGYCVQEDNVALEFNIPPSEGSEAVIKNINAVLKLLEEQAKDTFGAYFSQLSAASFPEEELDDPRARQFGCDPDFNAWSGRMNKKPKSHDWTLRSAGGHVHVGLENAGAYTRMDRLRLGRLMDLHLGIPSVVMDGGSLRKELYGKAGAMRMKEYGIEYRTLSNFWIFSPALIKWAWDATDRAVHDFAVGKDVKDMEEIIVNTINNDNKTAAAQLVTNFELCCTM